MTVRTVKQRLHEDCLSTAHAKDVQQRNRLHILLMAEMNRLVGVDRGHERFGPFQECSLNSLLGTKAGNAHWWGYELGHRLNERSLT
jgi:hypothetical protein